MDYKIIAPNKNYTGESAGVNFINGEGIAKNGKSIDYFRKKGYGIEPIEDKKEKPEDPPKTEKPDTGKNAKPKKPDNTEKAKEAKEDEKPQADGTGDVDDSSGNSSEKA